MTIAMDFKENQQLQLAFDFIHYTNRNIFLTGKAGTGKTTFLKKLKKNSPKRMVVVAPTGVAAINAGGVTIHSFFQLPFGPQIPQHIFNTGFPGAYQDQQRNNRINRFSKNKINIIRSLDLLVIDEISMVRADMLDAIDATLRRFKDRNQPFGGIQLLLIGDLQQLAPVLKDDEWNILKKYYDTCFFFSSLALKKSNFVGIELTHIYRQSEQTFIDLLNKVRENKMDATDLHLLNSRFIPGFSPPEEEGYITLTTHNYQANHINEAHLKKLPTKLHRFPCIVEGDFSEYAFPADENLEIKTGAQVMFLKNDASVEKRYYNGKIGKVTHIDGKEIEVLCPDDTETIIVEPDTWENTRYSLNEATAVIEEETVGRFTQYPLKLAWAITIHKSQGLTFEKAIIDAKQSFAHGQVYVALSRCKSLEGLVLSTPLDTHSVINDHTVLGFINQVEKNQPDHEELKKYRKEYELFLLKELIDFKTIFRTISWILKIWNDNASSLLGNLSSELQKMQKPLQQELISVAEKFIPQLEKLVSHNLRAEENGILQERIKKASGYFRLKLKEHIESPLESAGFETDNREVRKRITEILGKVETEIEIKRACLESVSEGFTIKTFLEARAKASLEKPAVKARKEAAAINITHKEFYRQLMEWRSKKSTESGMDEARILRRKTMIEMAESLPPTALELKAVKGMGGKKMEMFGQEILALILQYRQGKGMDIPLNATEEVKIAGLETKEVSLVFFNQGLSLVEIAKKRRMAVSTIEKHIAHFVARGDLDVFRLIDRQKYDIIAKCLNEKSETETTSNIKNRLGDTYSYGEIRLVMADLGRR